MRVLVCGGRDFTDYELVKRQLDSLIPRPTLIIHGAARGADTMASVYAAKNSIQQKTFPANWRMYGNSAGPIRNQQMLDEGKPDLVIAFPGGKGTAHMVRIAKTAGIKVIEVA